MGSVRLVTAGAGTTTDAVQRWNSGSVEIGGVRATPLGSAFTASGAVRQIDDLLVFGLKSSPHRIYAPVARAQGAEGVLRLRFQRSGTSVIRQDGVETTVCAGEWLLFDPARPHTATNEVEASQIFLQLPLDRLSEREARLARSCKRAIPYHGTVGGVLFECLRATIEDLGDTNPRTERDLGHSIVDLFRVLLGELEGEQAQRSGRDRLRERVRDHVRRHLHDSALSVDAIARAFGCSPRYIHKVFAGGETVSQYIWSQRLEQCRRALASDDGPARSLTELAFDLGFSSSSHFSRKFRERFGLSPTRYRQLARRGSDLQFGIRSDIPAPDND